MKKLLSIIILALAISSCKTAADVPHRTAPRYADFAQPTPKKDTLYLVKNESQSILIAKIWALDTIEKNKPAIEWVTSEQMLCIKQRCDGKYNMDK